MLMCFCMFPCTGTITGAQNERQKVAAFFFFLSLEVESSVCWLFGLFVLMSDSW